MNYIKADMNIITMFISMFDDIWISGCLIYGSEIFLFSSTCPERHWGPNTQPLLNGHFGRGGDPYLKIKNPKPENNPPLRLRLTVNWVYYYYYYYSALGPVWAETKVQSGDCYGSGTLHPGQVLRGSLPFLSPTFWMFPLFTTRWK